MNVSRKPAVISPTFHFTRSAWYPLQLKRFSPSLSIIWHLFQFQYSAGPFHGIMRKGCMQILKKIRPNYSQWRGFTESNTVPYTNSFREKLLSILASCMTNLSEFHIVFYFFPIHYGMISPWWLETQSACIYSKIDWTGIGEGIL